MSLHKRTHTTFSKQAKKPECATCGRTMATNELIECASCRKDLADSLTAPGRPPNEELALDDVRTPPRLDEMDMFFEPFRIDGRERPR